MVSRIGVAWLRGLQVPMAALPASQSRSRILVFTDRGGSMRNLQETPQTMLLVFPTPEQAEDSRVRSVNWRRGHAIERKHFLRRNRNHFFDPRRRFRQWDDDGELRSERAEPLPVENDRGSADTSSRCPAVLCRGGGRTEAATATSGARYRSRRTTA